MKIKIDMEAFEMEERAEVWHLFALWLGYNELAKTQETLGQKTYCRGIRDACEDELKKRGAVIETDPSDPSEILRLDNQVPIVTFRESDIELMRACVAEHDEELDHGESETTKEG